MADTQQADTVGDDIEDVDAIDLDDDFDNAYEDYDDLDDDDDEEDADDDEEFDDDDDEDAEDEDDPEIDEAADLEVLSHIDETGAAQMVDVGGKDVTARVAVAVGALVVSPETAELVAADGLAKPDVLATARIAGIQAVKRTPDLIPLCHPLRIDGVTIDFIVDTDEGVIEIQAEVRATDRTGVEMEAMTAVSVAALTLYDMVKAVERGAIIEQVRLEHKSGGASGDWDRPEEE